MKKRTFWLVVLAAVMLLAACSPLDMAPATQAGPKTGPTSTHPAEPRPAFMDGLRVELAKQQGVSADQVLLEEYQAAQWPDTCLGLAAANEVCAQTITPGYLVVFSSPEGMIEMHTDKTGKNYRVTRLESPPGQRPVALVWERSGGFAGLCQHLTLYLDGGYQLADCRSGDVLSEGQLPEDEYARLKDWQGQYADFRWQSVPPAGSADMFAEELSFNGNGSGVVSAVEQQELANAVNDLVVTLQPEQPAPAAVGSSGVEGTVLLAGGCAPEKPGVACQSQPFQAVILVTDMKDNYIASVKSDEQGVFRLELPAGEYKLKPEAPSSTPFAKEQRVKVEAGQYTRIKIVYDTGKP